MPPYRSEPDPEDHERLRTDEVIWLITVRKDGQPQPVPVWHLWDGERIFIYAREGSQKLRNIASNPRVALVLDTRDHGDRVIRMDGAARVTRDPVSPVEHQSFLERYRPGLVRIGRTPETFARDYTCAIEIQPDRWYIW